MAQKTVIQYPNQVFIIFFCKFCESFCFFGFIEILILYLRNVAQFSGGYPEVVPMIFCGFSWMAAPLGGIISDSWLAKYRTYVYSSWFYITGFILMTLTAIYALRLPQTAFCWISILVMFVGVAGTTPCLVTYGADQFIEPQQTRVLATYFFVYHIFTYLGVFLAVFITWYLKEMTFCYLEPSSSCHPLSFAIPAIILLGVTILLITTNRLYWFRVVLPRFNISLRWLKCIWKAATLKTKSKDNVPHWLDRAETTYGKDFVAKVKHSLQVICLVNMQFQVYYCCYFQTSILWTAQFHRMNNQLGPNFTVLPEQMTMLIPILIVFFMSILACCSYFLWHGSPMMRRPLQRIVFGLILAALAFLVSALISLLYLKSVEDGLLPKGEAEVRIYNPMNCQPEFISPIFVNHRKMEAMGYHKGRVKVKDTVRVEYTVGNCKVENPTGGNLAAKERYTTGYYLNTDGLASFGGKLEDDIYVNAKIKTLISDANFNGKLTYWRVVGNKRKAVKNVTRADTNIYISLDSGYYNIKNNKKLLRFDRGAIYTVLVYIDQGVVKHVKAYKEAESSDVSILWQLPQYILITLGEALIFPSALELMYTQSTLSVKAFMVALWYFVVGNGAALAIYFSKLFPLMTDWGFSFLIAGILVLDLIVFIILARRFKYVTYPSIQ